MNITSMATAFDFFYISKLIVALLICLAFFTLRYIKHSDLKFILKNVSKVLICILLLSIINIVFATNVLDMAFVYSDAINTETGEAFIMPMYNDSFYLEPTIVYGFTILALIFEMCALITLRRHIAKRWDKYVG